MSTRVVLVAFYLVLTGLPLYGQTNLGRILGVVRDSTGGVVPGATVVVRNDGTGWSREFVSQDTGHYEVTNLVPGTYSVTVELPSFKRFLRTGIVLDAARTVRIDVDLEIGEIGDEVRVEAPTPVVETDTPSISSSIGWDVQIKSAHSPGNRPWEALVTVPIFQSGAGTFVYTIGGSRGAQNEFHIDGIASPGGSSPLGSTSMTTFAARELKILGVNNSAEYSQPGIYEQISRGGTNQFHGNLLYMHQNSALNARPYFSPTKTKSRSHKFGLMLSGPLVLPHVYDGQDKTFIMVAYEGARNPNFRTANATVPTAGMRQGNFAGVASIKDPLTGQAFAGNQIPSARINPVSRRIQERFYPLPNYGNLNVFTTLNHRIIFDNSGGFNHGDVRLDHKISDRNTVYARVGWMQFPVKNLQSNLPTVGELNRLRSFWNAVISDTHTFSPQLVNEFRTGFVRSQDPGHGPQKGLEVLSSVGIQGISDVPDAFGMPVINITGLQSLTQAREGVSIDQIGQLSDSLTWVRGKHSLKVGLDLRRPLPYDNIVPVGTYGTFTFTGTFSGSPYADFLLGLPARSQRAYPQPNDFRRQWESGFFVQDDFRLSPRLTLQLGLRYEYQTPTGHERHTLYNFDPAAGQVILASEKARPFVSPLFNPKVPIVVADGGRFPVDRLWVPDKNNWAPRIGFAFRPTGANDFAVRGGYAVFYDTIGYGLVSNFTTGPFTRGADSFANKITQGVPLFQFPTPFPNTQAGPSTSPPSLNAILTGLRNPYVQQWNLTAEKEYLGVGLRASYIETKGTRLLVKRNINVPAPSATRFSQSRRPNPLYGDIQLFDQGGNSIYHALQLEAIRRVGSLSFNIGYTWANNISDAPDIGEDIAGAMENPYDRRAERGREAYALQHRLVANLLWRIPVGRGRHFLADLPGPLDQVLGGWETVWTFFAHSGLWFNPVVNGDPANIGATSGRPDRLRDGRLTDPAAERWFDASAFAALPVNAGRFGTSGRNILEGPGRKVLHLSLVKDFNLRESLKLSFAVAARNLFNHPNFRNPTNNISSPRTVARITGIAGDLEHFETRQIEARLIVSW